MTFILADTTIQESIRSAASAGNWQLAYQRVIDALTDPATGEAYSNVDPAVYIWVQGVKGVNGSQGAFASYIRDYTARQYELRNGTQANDIDELIQDASDQIASNFIKQFLYGNTNTEFTTPVTSPSQLPDLHTVGLNDAAGAASRVFPSATSSGANNYSPWAGTPLFTNLGDGSFFGDWVLTRETSPFKQEAGTYDLISIAQVTLEFKTVGRLIDTVWNLEFPTYAATVFGLGSGERTTNAEATNTFMTSTYGEVVDEFDFGSAIFFPFSFNPYKYRVGTVFDDTGAKAITLATDDAFVHAGAGNDQIVAPGSWVAALGIDGVTIIDGGNGNDTVDYSAITTDYSGLASGITIQFDDIGAFGSRAIVLKSGAAGPVPRDYVYNVEKFIGTSQGDTVEIAKLANSFPEIDLGTNPEDSPDRVDLSGISQGIKIDMGATGPTFGSGLTLKVKGAEVVIGTSGDDSINGGAADDKVSGGGGADKIIGGAGNDILFGEDGNDFIKGDDAGDDLLLGGSRADYIIAGKGDDIVDGGPGNDYIEINGTDGATIVFAEGSGHDVLGSMFTKREGSPYVGAPGHVPYKWYDDELHSDVLVKFESLEAGDVELVWDFEEDLYGQGESFWGGTRWGEAALRIISTGDTLYLGDLPDILYQPQ